MKSFAYFPGCSAESTGLAFTRSSAFVAEQIGFKLTEIPDWNCCGTMAAKLENHELGYALSARNLAIAEQMEGHPDVVASCAGCYQALNLARRFVRESEENREHIEELISMPYAGEAKVVSLLEAMSDEETIKMVKATVMKPLRGLKAACYYGCTLVRPEYEGSFDDPENPQSMDNMMRAIGAEPVDWAFKTECCSGSQAVAMPGASKVLIERIFQNAVANGAECIVTTCPLCQLNLDMREAEINKSRIARGLEPFDIPCYYFTELVGAAQGGRADELGIDLHFHPAWEFLADAKLRAIEILEKERAEAEEAARQEAERAAKIAAAKAAQAAKAAAAKAKKAGKDEEAAPAKKAPKKPEPTVSTYQKPRHSQEEKELKAAQEALALKQAQLNAARATEEMLREELAKQAEELARAKRRADARAAFENVHDDASGFEHTPLPAMPDSTRSAPVPSAAPATKEVTDNE